MVVGVTGISPDACYCNLIVRIIQHLKKKVKFFLNNGSFVLSRVNHYFKNKRYLGYIHFFAYSYGIKEEGTSNNRILSPISFLQTLRDETIGRHRYHCHSRHRGHSRHRYRHHCHHHYLRALFPQALFPQAFHHLS